MRGSTANRRDTRLTSRTTPPDPGAASHPGTPAAEGQPPGVAAPTVPLASRRRSSAQQDALEAGFASFVQTREYRLAAYNLMEDAEHARRRSEADRVERRRAERAMVASQERLRLLVDNAREYAILGLDRDRRITSWNRGATMMLGYTAAEMQGASADILFTAEDRAAGAPQREAARAIEEERASDERWHVRKDGSRFWGSGALMAMRDDTGTPIGFVKIFRDQTRELLAQQALEEGRTRLVAALAETERARAEAETAGKAKDYFLAVLSHELRTPLTPVLLAVQMLERRRELPPQVLQTLATIRRNVQLEARFVDELLDITKISRGKLELLREPMDLHEAVAHAVDLCLPDIDAKHQRVEVTMADAHHRIEGDVRRLQQGVWNLVKNASKFSGEGGVIRVRTFDAPAGVTIEVADDGIGIDPARLSHVFEPFNQADPTITRRFGGLGLGLAIAKATVAAHGGAITAASAGLGCGATFTLVLPVAATPAAATA